MQMIYSRETNGRKVDRRSAFTLVELLVVLAIVVILAALSFKSLSGILSGGFNQVVSDMSQALAQARAYAMANNTYVYVGFDEVSASDTSATPATGAGNYGLVVVAIAASSDGTNGFTNGTTWSSSSAVGTTITYNLVAISKLMKFPNVDLPGSQAGSPPSPPAGFTIPSAPPPVNNMYRPTPGYYLSATNPPSGTSGSYCFTWPFPNAQGTPPGTVNYYFNNLIRFGPQGDATLITSASKPTTVPMVDYIEVDIQPSHGNTVGTTPTNVCALQIDGSTGLVKTYRP